MHFFEDVNQIQVVISKLTTRWCCMHPFNFSKKTLLILAFSSWNCNICPHKLWLKMKNILKYLRRRVCHKLSVPIWHYRQAMTHTRVSSPFAKLLEYPVHKSKCQSNTLHTSIMLLTIPSLHPILWTYTSYVALHTSLLLHTTQLHTTDTNSFTWAHLW